MSGTRSPPPRPLPAAAAAATAAGDVARVRLVGDRMEVASRPRRVVAAERRLVVRVAARAHVTARRQTLVSRVRRVRCLAAGRRNTARTGAEHVRLVPGSKLLADSFAILQHRQSSRSRLHQNVSALPHRLHG